MKTLKLWQWWAMDAQGVIQQGVMFCSDSTVLTHRLVQNNMALIKLKSGRHYQRRHWHPEQKIALFHQIGTLLHAGLSLPDAIKLLADGELRLHWQALMHDLYQRLLQGEPFSEVLNAWPEIFPPLYSSMMSVGELTGTLATCCTALAQQQMRQRQLQKKVLKALRYPLFILLIALAVSVGMMLFVLPQFAAIYASFDAPLPAFTRSVLLLSEILQHQGGIILFISILLWLLRRYFLYRVGWQRCEQRLLLRLPLISSVWRGGQLTLIYTTLSLTQRAGLTLLQGLQAVEKVLTSVLWQQAILALQKHIAEGYPLHQGIGLSGLFTPLCRQLLRTGEETGTLDTLLVQLAEWHETHTHELADTLAASLEPLMMLMTGIIVGMLVIAMYLPLFGLGEVISG
ncbi:protein transport protein HofC [Enterobacteriaceae bacterium LUAb1]